MLKENAPCWTEFFHLGAGLIKGLVTVLHKPAFKQMALAMGVAIFFLISILGLASAVIWQNYRSAIAAGEARAESSAHVVAAHLKWMIEASDQALRRIDSALGIQFRPDAISDISQAVGDLPVGFQYSVYDQSGELRMSSLPHPAGINVSDREYFKELRDGGSIVISPQLRERASDKQVFIIAHRIDRQGDFRGVASIAIPTQRMDEFWSSMALGPNSSVGIIRTDGWLVARHPEITRPLNLIKTPLFESYLSKSPAGFYHSTASPADGIQRIVGYWRVEGWPLISTAGIDRNATLALFRSSLQIQLLFGLPIAALLMVGAVWIAWLLNAYAARNTAVETALERNQFLFREIHHRVKNNLQVVASLVRLQPIPPEARKDMERRIAAMVAVHEQIYESDQFERVEVAPYIEKLVKGIAATYSGDVNIETKLQQMTVDRDQALPIGMIINEVVSNAFKYAFLGRTNGNLLIEMFGELKGPINIVIKDDGPGMVSSTETKGMGYRLIKAFVTQLGGEFKLAGGHGTCFTLIFPAEAG